MINPSSVSAGMRILYAPVRGGPFFSGTVDSEPWMLGGHTWVAHLRDMEPAYAVAVGVPGKTTVVAASLRHLRAAP